MLLNQEIKDKIYSEYNSFKENLYAGKSLEERKQLDQFFTPPELTIAMIEKFDCDCLEDKTILDPCCGSGNLLAACLIAGAKPENCFGNDYDLDMVELCRERLAEFDVPRNNIHQGNALHSFCIVKSNFTESYESEYFGRANANKDKRFEVMNSDKADENAWDKTRKRNKPLYELHQQQVKQRQDEISVNDVQKAAQEAEYKTKLW